MILLSISGVDIIILNVIKLKKIYLKNNELSPIKLISHIEQFRKFRRPLGSGVDGTFSYNYFRLKKKQIRMKSVIIM